MQDGPSRLVHSEQGVLSRRASVVGIAGDEVGLLSHPYFLNIFHAFGVLFPHEGDSLIRPLYVFKCLH